MAKNQGPRRSDEEWFRLINECRRSGLSDSLWCKQQGIPASSFFSAVRRLREKAYALPERERSIDIVSNPLPCQDVVRIDIEPNPFTGKEPEPLQVIPGRNCQSERSEYVPLSLVSVGRTAPNRLIRRSL